jgi:hypothetical protein
LDKRGELGDRWSVIHRRRGCPCVRNHARRQLENLHLPAPMNSHGAPLLRQARRAAAAFNQMPTPHSRRSFASEIQIGHVAGSGRLSFFR